MTKTICTNRDCPICKSLGKNMNEFHKYTHHCQDWREDESERRPGCLMIASPEYTMYFDDIGEPPIYFCANCGPEAQAMDAVIKKAFKEGGEEFAKKFEAAIEKAERGEEE